MFLKTTVLMLCVTSAALPAQIKDARLSEAAMDGNQGLVKSLLQQKADVNGAQGDGSTALHWAATRDDVAMAQLLLKAGASVNAPSRIGAVTPLFLAARNGSAKMLDLMLASGGDANAADGLGATPLMLAAAAGNPDAVQLLLDHGAAVNAKEATWGETPLMFAAALNRSAVVKMLIAHGADSQIETLVERVDRAGVQANRDKNAEGRTAATKRTNNEGCSDSLDCKGIATMGGMTALLFAVREGQMETVRTLVGAGAGVNEVNAADKVSALTLAIFNGHYDIAKFLLDSGADPKLVNVDGLGPLYATIDMQYANRTWYPPANIEQEKVSYLDLIKDLLARGADPDQQIKKKLWFRRFHDDWVDAIGATPFWRAAQADDVAAMKLLVAAGANTKLTSAHQATPLIVACGYGLEDQTSVVVPGARMAAVRYLVEETGADVNTPDDKGYTPLHGAAYEGDNEVILYLVSKGANIRATSHGLVSREGQDVSEVGKGKGDTVADMANGPREHGMLHPDTVGLAVKLGSINSNNCRSSTCVVNGGR